MRSPNYMNKVRLCGLIVLALLVYQAVEPRLMLSNAKVLPGVQGSSAACYKESEHQKNGSQKGGSKKPAQILRNHQPERLIENRQVVSAQTEFALPLDHGACEQREPEEILVLNFLVLYSIPAKRAPPLISSL